MIFLDYLFNVIHGSLIVFNVFGWLWYRTRRLHLLTIVLTFFSWFALGVLYGWGYCPLTDWHWDVKRDLGQINLPNSFIKYHLDMLIGYDWDAVTVDAATLIVGLSVLVLSCDLNYRDYKSR